MNRRHFVKQAAVAAPLIIAFNPLAAMRKSFLQNLTPEGSYKNRILVLIELTGGNDGLNTVIPIDKYKILSEARCDILIPENKILQLNDTNVFGFHPSMTSLQKLYYDKLVTIVQGVGHPEPEFSHFRAKAMKYTANIEKEEIKSGWVGRYLGREYPHYPKGYPLHRTDGPPAIRFGEASPRITQFIPAPSQDIEDLSIGLANISDFSTSSTAPEDDPVSNTPAGENIHKIRAVSQQIKLYSPIIQSFASRKQNLSKLYPEPQRNPLADQLKMVARLIGSGLNTPVYIVEQSDYDTHGDQVDRADTTRGQHAKLLRDLSEAIWAFEDDLCLMGKQDDVLGMTFSEFGRRIKSGSYGTDHGTAETVFLFGTKLKNGIMGTSPELPSKVTRDDNLPVQFDFRALYKSVLRGWFGISEDRVKTIIAQGPDERLELFNT